MRDVLTRLNYYADYIKQQFTRNGMSQYYATALESFKFWSTPNEFMNYSTADFKPWHAVGMVANEDKETSFMWWAVGDKGTAHGSFQWHDDRRYAILKFTHIDILKCSHMDNLRAALWELNNPEKFAKVNILNTTNAYDAGAAVCKSYERAGSPDAMHVRAQRAVFWAKHFGLPINECTPIGRQLLG